MGFAWVMLGRGSFFSRKHSRRPHRDPQKLIIHTKQVSAWNGDHEWLRMTNALILCDLLWKVQNRYTANRKGNFNHSNIIVNIDFLSIGATILMFRKVLTNRFFHSCFIKWVHILCTFSILHPLIIALCSDTWPTVIDTILFIYFVIYLIFIRVKDS